MRKPHRTYDVKPRAGLDRVAFIAAFGAGVGGGILLKLFGVHPFLAAGFSAAVLIGYAIVLWASGRLRLDPEAIGDNCYYLGFLFTLASLAVTLYQVAAPAPGTTQVALLPEVISGFGVALSSTIVGVFLRVLMMQMRPDFVAAENQARTELSAAAREFRTQLGTSTLDLKGFSVEAVQRAAERDQKMQEMTDNFIKEAYAKMSESQNELMKQAEQTLAETVKQMSKEISRSFDDTAKSMGGSIKTLDDSISGMVEKVSDLGRSTETLKGHIDGFSADFGSARDTISETMAAIAGETAEAEIAVKGFSSNISRAATRIENKTIPAMEAFEERLARLPAKPPPPMALQSKQSNVSDRSASDTFEDGLATGSEST